MGVRGWVGVANDRPIYTYARSLSAFLHSPTTVIIVPVSLFTSALYSCKMNFPSAPPPGRRTPAMTCTVVWGDLLSSLSSTLADA